LNKSGFGTGNSIIGNLFNSVILGGQSNYICGDSYLWYLV